MIQQQYEALYPKPKKKKENDRFADLNGPTKLDSKYSWYEMIQRFINELHITEKKFYKMKYLHALNWMSYWYNRDKVIEAQRKAQK